MGKIITVLFVSLLLSGCAFNKIHRDAVLAEAPINGDSLKEFAGSCFWSGDSLKDSNPYERDAKIRAEADATCGQHSVEVTNRYSLFYVEFDEQGRLYDDRQFSQLFSYLEGKIACGADLSIVAFVHGWRHNSHYNDTNVALARSVLEFTSAGEAAEPHPNAFRQKNLEREKGKVPANCGSYVRGDKPIPREVVGIYVGWRGKSLDGGRLFSYWELPSVWDRKNTAENVAVGSVRELFSALRVFQVRNNVDENNCEPQANPYQCKRVRLLIIGHSFGGLLVFNAVSGSIMDSLSQGNGIDPNKENCKDGPSLSSSSERDASMKANRTNLDSPLVRSFADLIILINPAIEGVRYEPLHQAVQRRLKSKMRFCPNQKPVLVVVTANNDNATHYAFPLVRVFSTMFESDRPIGVNTDGADEMLAVRQEDEREASISAMGHIKRFQTYDINGGEPQNGEDARATIQPSTIASGCEPNCSASTPDPLEKAIQICRSGGVLWGQYIEQARDNRSSDTSSCPSFVEEVNASRLKGMGAFCGGTTLSLRAPYLAKRYQDTSTKAPDWAITRNSQNSPIWMIKTYDTSIVDGHNDIKFPFQIFVKQLYHNISLQNYDDAAFYDLGENAKANFDKFHCRDVSPQDAAPSR